MKWIKASERKPNCWDFISVRFIHTRLPLLDVASMLETNPNNIHVIEWLDESSTTTYGEMVSLLKEYEQWEADLINDNKMWWPYAPKDAISGKTYDKMIELQSKRNTLINQVQHNIQTIN